MKKKNNFEKQRTAYAILGFLAKSPKSGYELNQAISQSTNYFWKESFGQIYPILKKLEDSSYIRKGNVELSGKRKSQKYEITEAGLDALSSWIAHSVEHDVVRNELLLKLFFGRHVAPKTLIKHVAEHKAFCRKQLDLFMEYKASFIAKSTTKNSETIFFLIPLNHGIATYSSQIKWCDETIEALENIDIKSGSSEV